MGIRWAGSTFSPGDNNLVCCPDCKRAVRQKKKNTVRVQRKGRRVRVCRGCGRPTPTQLPGKGNVGDRHGSLLA